MGEFSYTASAAHRCPFGQECPPAAPVVRAEDAGGGELLEALRAAVAQVVAERGWGWFAQREIVDGVHALMAEAPALRELAAAAAKVRRMEAEHRPEQIEDVGPEGPVAIAICVADHDYWPCDVRRALDGEVDR